MSEVKFIRGMGKGQCTLLQQGEEFVVLDRFNFQEQKEFRFDNLMNAILFAQEHFAVVNFREPLAFKEPAPA
jgi:hypothetical protein